MGIIVTISQLRSNACTYLESKIGAPSEQICLILTILLTIPFCFINYLLHGKQLRLFYSLILGLIFQYSIYGYNIIHTLVSSILVYLYLCFLGRKMTPFVVLVLTIVHLAALHIYRMFVDYGGWTIDDPTTIYMMTVCKYSSIAFSYDDGKKEDKEFKSEHHKSYKIVEKPTFVEFFSYIYFYPTALIGPFIEYKDFINFINEEDCYKNLNQKFGYIFFHGLLKFLLSFVFIGIYSFLSPKLPMTLLGEAEFTKKYPKFWQRAVFLYLCPPTIRAKYYSGWTLSHSTVIFCGFAYGETVKEGKVSRNLEKGNYGSLLFNEFGMNPKFKMVYWNTSIHLWLKYNVYTRVLSGPAPFKNNRTLASLITYVFSAFWHGFYPAYYISFVLVYLFEQGDQFLEMLGFYKYVDERVYLWPFVSIRTTYIFNSIGTVFYNLEYKNFVQMLKNLYGFPLNYIVFMFVLSVGFRLGGFGKKPKKIDDKAKINNKDNNGDKKKSG